MTLPADPPTRIERLAHLPREQQYRRLRRELLARIFTGPHRDNYVLRGSTVLKHWFGAAAREPNDLDLVAVYPHDPERCIRETIAACTGPGPGEPFPLRRENVLPVWEYDIFPGVRFHVPAGPGFRLPTAQLDIAFDNTPPLPREVVHLRPVPDEPAVEVVAWTRTSCLASKLCWIAADCTAGDNPDADDLGDALLLAEHGEIDAVELQRIVPLILAAQGRDLSAFDAWDERVRAGLALTAKPSEPPGRGRNLPAAETRRAYGEFRDGERNWLLARLQPLIAPLLGGLIWFPVADEWAFLRNLARNPTDQLIRLVYADWLDDRADPRGELLRLELAARTGLELTNTQQSRRSELWASMPTKWARLAGLGG